MHTLDRLNLWHKLPVFLGLIYLERRRTLHDKYNLLNVGEMNGIPFNPEDYPYRTMNGEYNDPENNKAGSQLTFFGRNMPLVEQKDEVIISKPA